MAPPCLPEHDTTELLKNVTSPATTATQPPFVLADPLFNTTPVNVTLEPLATTKSRFVLPPLRAAEELLMMVTETPVMVMVESMCISLATAHVEPLRVVQFDRSLKLDTLIVLPVGRSVGRNVAVGCRVVGEGVVVGSGEGRNVDEGAELTLGEGVWQSLSSSKYDALSPLVVPQGQAVQFSPAPRLVVE